MRLPDYGFMQDASAEIPTPFDLLFFRRDVRSVSRDATL